MKGVRYRVGSIKPQRVTSEEWKHIDSGTLYLTNKRLIFTGRLRNSTINLTKILSFTPYSDAIEISKETGRPPFLKFSNNTDMFALILSRLLNGSHCLQHAVADAQLLSIKNAGCFSI